MTTTSWKAASCAFVLLILISIEAQADDWPQWRGPNRDGVWREVGVVDRFESEQLEIRWRAPIGAGYSGPTVADGRVYVSDRVVEPKQIERAHCFDVKTGKLIWSHSYECPYTISYPAGPRACVTLNEGRAYSLGAMGHLFCFAADTGQVLWKKDLQTEYKIRMPIWGIAAAPLIFDDQLIVQIGGSDGACIVSFDKRDGDQRWHALDDQASYSAPIVIQQAGQKVIVCWTGDSVTGLNPQTGKTHWRYAFPPSKMPIGISTPVVDRDRLFVTSFYDGSLMLRINQNRPAVERIWQRRGLDEKNTDALHSIISTPLLKGNHLFGVDSYGELRCLDANSGDRIWEDQTATPRDRWSNIHMVTNGDRVWMFNEPGELIIAQLSGDRFHEISRTKLIAPTTVQLRRREGVCWAHPAFANRHVFARNDEELVCASLVAKQ